MAKTALTPKALRARRKALLISQIKVSEALGISPYPYRLWESHGLALPRGLKAEDVATVIDRLAQNGGQA